MKNKSATEKISLTYGSESGVICLNNKPIANWDNEATINYPEDLTWARDITDLVRKAVQAGYDLAQEEIKDSLTR